MSIITDVYKALFGKDHIQDGNVIDFSEHGRVGGVSTGQGFKFTVPIDGATPLEGNNPSITITEVIAGDVTTTTIEKLIGATTYTKTVVENASTGITTVSGWS